MLEEVWNAKVVVKVMVYPQVHDSHSTPFYCTAKRIHYPSSLLNHLARFYSCLGDDTVSQMIIDKRVVFETKNQVIVRWNQPIGLLCDLTLSGEEWLELRLVMSTASPVLGDPHDLAKSAYFNSLKEAEAMRRSKPGRVMELTRPQQQSLWDAVQSEGGNWGNFVGIVSKLVVDPKMAAVKVYECKEGEVMVRTGPVQLYEELTVGDVVKSVILGEHYYRLVCHGIDVDKSTPFMEMMTWLTFPDTMVHLVVHRAP